MPDFAARPQPQRLDEASGSPPDRDVERVVREKTGIEYIGYGYKKILRCGLDQDPLHAQTCCPSS
ncbi:MAG: hypothetical protein JOZ32_13355 [Bryobacterales bacterium]|nr:hypothetical protein [Bryobacterales bacterium]